MKRIKKLALKASNFVEFMAEIEAHLTWYEIPGKGSIDDYQTFYNAIKRGC